MVPVPSLLPFLLAAATTAVAGAQRTPDEALRALRDGNDRFAAGRSVVPPLGEGVRRTLARGASPFAVVLCCADSRVPPEHVFNCGLGDLVVVRVAGAMASAEAVAALEDAVERLGVPLGLVLAHEDCGAIAAALDPAAVPAPGPAMRALLERIEPSLRQVRERALADKELRDAAEDEHAQATVHECLRRSPLLRRHATAGRFRLVAARYHLEAGTVEWLPERPLPAESPLERAATPLPAVPPHVALRLLQAGHRRFLGDGAPTADLTARRRSELAFGQQPVAIVLACADARVAPEHLFDAGLGELAVLRLPGHTLNDDALASIEHAAGALGASLLVVLGHTGCEALHAAARHPERSELTPSQRALLLRLEPAVAAARAAALPGEPVAEHAVRGHALRTVAEVRARSALLRELEQAGRFVVLGCVYDVAAGDLEWLKDAAPSAPRVRADGADALEPHPAPAPAPPAAPAGEALARVDECADAARTTPPAAQPAPAPARAEPAPAPATAVSGGGRGPESVVLLGIAGIASLVAAALLAWRHR